MLTALTTLLVLSSTPATDDLREDVTRKEDVVVSTRAGRMGGAFLGEAVAAAATVTAGTIVFTAVWGASGFASPCMWSCSASTSNSTFDEAMIAGLAVDLIGFVFLTPVGAWLGHELAGGEGVVGAAFAGGMIGATVAAAAFIGGIMMMNGDGTRTAVAATMMTAGSLALVAGPIIGLELSHSARLAPRIAVAPVKEGGMVSLAWEF